MGRDLRKLSLAATFTVLIVFSLALIPPTSAQPATASFVVSPSSITVSSSSTFTIDISIDLVQGYPMIMWLLVVSWDPSLMELADGYHANQIVADGWQKQRVTDRGWEWDGNEGQSWILVHSWTIDTSWSTEDVWLTLAFHCLAPGQSDVVVGSLQNVDTGYVIHTLPTGGWEMVYPEDVSVPCSQLQPSRQPVGGELFAANKFAVLSPYLTLIGLIGTVSTTWVLIRRRRTQLT